MNWEGRPSSGILIYYEKKNLITIYTKTSKNILWFRVLKGFVVLNDKKVYIARQVYIIVPKIQFIQKTMNVMF